jgi:nitrogen regulatory protein P-II 2
MTKHPKTLLVIFAEAVLERRLVADAKRLGAHGYTVWDVRGGSGLESAQVQMREGAWDSDRTIEMKLICSEAVADAIAEHVLQTYAPHHGVSLYLAPVQVMRPEKF